MGDEHEILGLSSRRKKSFSVSLSCCFHRGDSFLPTSDLSPRKSPSRWIKSKSHDNFPDNKGKCRSFISRMRRQRRHSSADFSYDPLSYALNFDDDDTRDIHDINRSPVRSNFLTRLPVPPLPLVAETRMSGELSLSASTGQAVEEVKRGLEIPVDPKERKKSFDFNEMTPAIRSIDMAIPRERQKSLGASTRSLEEPTSPAAGASRFSREILVELC